MKIAIAGYYGFGNFGDELILSLLLRQIRKRMPTARVRILSADPAQTLQTHRAEAINRWNPLAVLWELFRSDLFVLGGGGLIQIQTSVRSLWYYLLLVVSARRLRCRVWIYGVGAEGTLSGWNAAFVRFALGGGSVVLTVRDRESKRILSGCGIDPARIHVSADPAFLLLGEIGKRPSAAGHGPVVLIPRAPVHPAHLETYRAIIKELQREFGGEIQGFLFQPDVESSLFETYFPDIQWFSYDFSKKNARLIGMKMLEESRLIVSARFHGCLLAMGLGRPFVGVGDSQKVGRFCAEWESSFIPWGATDVSAVGRWKSLQAVIGSTRDRDKLWEAHRRAEKIFETLHAE